MAKTIPQRGKVKSIRDENAAEVNQAADTAVPEPPIEPEPPEPTPAKKPPRVLSFMQQVGAVPKADWGTRYQIKVYRLAPIIDRLRGSENKYVTIYHEPIDEEKLKVDHGSGRYRLYLNCKSPAVKGEKEIDMIELDILDMAFPPRIPPSEWVDDPRNKQWAWAAPKGSVYHQGQPEAPMPVDPMQHLKTFIEIQDQIESRMPKAEVIDPVAQANATISLMKEAAALSRPADGNGMSVFMQQEIAAMRAEVAAARERGDRLMEKLIANSAAPKSDGLSTLKEIIGTVKEFLPTVKEFMPAAGEAMAPRREREPWWTGILQTSIEAVQPAIGIIAHGIMQRAQQPQVQVRPQANGNGASVSTAPAIGEPDIWDMLLNALTTDASGEDFAESVNTLFGAMRYKQACMLGENGLLTVLKGHPIWERLGPFQEKMPQFIHEFVSYGQSESGDDEPEPDDDPAQPDAAPEDRSHQPAVEL